MSARERTRRRSHEPIQGNAHSARFSWGRFRRSRFGRDFNETFACLFLRLAERVRNVGRVIPSLYQCHLEDVRCGMCRPQLLVPE